MSIAGLVHDFGSLRALDAVDLVVESGEVVALLGHNGAGKTTTLRHVTGVLAPTAGQVRVFGLDPLVDGVSVRSRLGVLPATAAIDDHLTGAANLRFVADLWDVPVGTAERRITELLDLFELTDRAGERAGGYSTGMRQRLALARVLVHDPDLLLLDEPTAALDPVAAHRVRDLIGQLAREKRRTVLLCTHNLAEAEALCDRVVILQQGRVMADDSPAELIRGLTARRLMIDVDPTEAARAIEVVSCEGGHAGVAADGVVEVTGIARADIPALVSRLASAGVPIYAVRPDTHALEDVYLALHNNRSGGSS